jgi:hypothetical protein
MGFMSDFPITQPHADCRPIERQLRWLADHDPARRRIADQAIRYIEQTVLGWLLRCPAANTIWHARVAFCGLRFRFTYGQDAGRPSLIVWQISVTPPHYPAISIEHGGAVAVKSLIDCALALDAFMRGSSRATGQLARLQTAVATSVPVQAQVALRMTAGSGTTTGLYQPLPGGMGPVQDHGQVALCVGHAARTAPPAVTAPVPPPPVSAASPIRWHGRCSPLDGVWESGATPMIQRSKCADRANGGINFTSVAPFATKNGTPSINADTVIPDAWLIGVLPLGGNRLGGIKQ